MHDPRWAAPHPHPLHTQVVPHCTATFIYLCTSEGVFLKTTVWLTANLALSTWFSLIMKVDLPSDYYRL